MVKTSSRDWLSSSLDSVISSLSSTFARKAMVLPGLLGMVKDFFSMWQVPLVRLLSFVSSLPMSLQLPCPGRRTQKRVSVFEPPLTRPSVVSVLLLLQTFTVRVTSCVAVRRWPYSAFFSVPFWRMSKSMVRLGWEVGGCGVGVVLPLPLPPELTPIAMPVV